MTGFHKELNGAPIGVVTEPCTCCSPTYTIVNNREEPRYTISADCCQCGLMCRGSLLGKCYEVQFPIYKADNKNMSNCAFIWVNSNREHKMHVVSDRLLSAI